MANILPIIQIIISVLLILAILMQTSAAGLGGAFGDSSGSDSGHHTRRGVEKVLFNGTIILGILFAVVSFVIFVLS